MIRICVMSLCPYFHDLWPSCAIILRTEFAGIFSSTVSFLCNYSATTNDRDFQGLVEVVDPVDVSDLGRSEAADRAAVVNICLQMNMRIRPV